MFRQSTLQNPITVQGHGLHTGAEIELVLRPAEVGTGIRLRRTDTQPVTEIPASPEYVTDTSLSTTVGIGEVHISTVEHLMSALCAMGVDNAWVEVNGGEIPILDGSAADFIFLLQSAGIVEQEAPRQFIRILETVRVEDRQRDAYALLEPYDGLRVSFTLVYDHPVLRDHGREVSVDLTSACYIREISRARTFGFVEDLKTMHSQQKALGASLDNVVAVDDEAIVNESGLRYENEFTRHKILDALGDLYLLGKPLLGHFTGYKSGHHVNNLLVNKLLDSPDCWELVTREALDSASAADETASRSASL